MSGTTYEYKICILVVSLPIHWLDYLPTSLARPVYEVTLQGKIRRLKCPVNHIGTRSLSRSSQLFRSPPPKVFIKCGRKVATGTYIRKYRSLYILGTKRQPSSLRKKKGSIPEIQRRHNSELKWRVVLRWLCSSK